MAWRDVGTVEDYPKGSMRNLSLDGRLVLVVHTSDGFHAMDGRCSHMGMDLGRGRLDGDTVECSLHHAVFDVRDGKVLRNLAARDLRTYPVRVEGGRVLLDL